MPKSWDGEDLYFKYFWSHAATTVNFDVFWEVSAHYVSDNELLDIGPYYFDGGALDTGGVTDKLYVSAESDGALNLSGASDGDLIIFKVQREPSADNLAIDARLHGIQIFYNTTAPTDD